MLRNSKGNTVVEIMDELRTDVASERLNVYHAIYSLHTVLPQDH